VTIWTRRASFAWRQNIGFYEHRYKVLRHLDEKGLLRRFLEREDQLAIRLQGPHQVVTFTPEGLQWGLLKPDADIEVIRTAVEVICKELQPQLRGYSRFGFQALEPCTKSYDEARSAAVAAYLGTEHPGRIIDFALSLDGKLAAPFDDWWMQAGIVNASEMSLRLARGLRRRITEISSPPSLWSPDELPAVAVFSDVEVDIAPFEAPVDIVATMFSAFDSARVLADELSASVLKPLEHCDL